MRHRDRFLFIFLLPLALAAQDEPRPNPQASGGEDKDPYTERFEQLDRDRDGYVSRGEWPLDAASFDRVDRNRDGRLGRNELLTPNDLPIDPVADEFQGLDTNRDGCLSWSEWQRGRNGPERQGRNIGGSGVRSETGTGVRDRESTWNPGASLQDQRRFQHLDRNRDNRLSRIEWTGSRASFDRLDRNRDGVLSPNEWSR